MARIVKEEEYNAKRNEILSYALSLVYSKGYLTMTIQDILDGLKISRGALYHYFDSKQAILEGMVDRLVQESEQLLLPIVEDAELSAIEKYRHYLAAAAGWKRAEKPLIMELLRVWYSEGNAFLRQKMTSESLKRIARLIERIIRQGIEEKVFATQYPAQVANICVGLSLSLTDSMVDLILSPKPDQDPLQEMAAITNACFESIERILGAPEGSLKIFDAHSFEEWFIPG